MNAQPVQANVPALPRIHNRRTIWIARGIAAGADALQIFLFPFFGEGFASPANAALDVIVGIVMVKLLGFHWAFLPTVAAEALPVFDLVPTWTGAVFLVTGLETRPWLKKALIAFAIAAVALFAVGLWWFTHRSAS